jgi:hypothetical protein
MADDNRNEGEGSRTAARQYNEGVQSHIRKGNVDKEAHDAAKAVEGSEGEDLRQAEETGKSHAKEKDI